ncbi:MAG: RNA polymerase-binding protein DksA [Desulfobacteraceae bacterium]|nr:MAG: RNA polymerase-binding protein DksA [Desulfobacteraceae bacterium]
MNKKQKEHFEKILNQHLDELLRQANRTMAEMVSKNGQEIEYLDRASADADQTFRLKIRSRESLLIKKIRQALERIENKTYGYCDTCGESISIKRLEARPVTSKCIRCKEEEERYEKRAS